MGIYGRLGLGIVADGIGGQPGGALASRVAVDSIAAQVRDGAELQNAAVHADRDVANAGRKVDKEGLGTTFVAVRFVDRQFQVAWAGDSRAYRIAGKAECLTRDHSVVSDLQARGEITAEQAAVHPMRNMLTRALGSGALRIKDVDSVKAMLGDRESLLLCSDGLHDVLTDNDIWEIIQSVPGVSAAAEALLDAALERGAPDNVTLALIG